MGFSENILGKDIYKIEISDIISFFSIEQEESAIIEFKSGDCEIEALYKEVSAFLNTEGGLIIVGSPKETRSASGKKACIGAPSVSKFKSKDFIYQKLASNIVPMPANIKIQEIPYENGVIYILDIPQSKTPPHQVAEEGKYYIRLEREAKPCPHGVVQALFQQRVYPDLKWQIGIYEKKTGQEQVVDFTISNESDCVAKEIIYSIETVGVKTITPLNDSCEFEQVNPIKGIFEALNVTKLYLSPDASLTMRLSFKPINNLALFYLSCICINGRKATTKTILLGTNHHQFEVKDGEEDDELTTKAYSDIGQKPPAIIDLPVYIV